MGAADECRASIAYEGTGIFADSDNLSNIAFTKFFGSF